MMMIRYSKHIIFTVFSLTLLCSCATILNSKKTNLTILTSAPTHLVMDNDTVKKMSTSKSFLVNRSKKPLVISVYNDSLAKTVSIKSRISSTYWLNAYPFFNFWTGFLIDIQTGKLYTYPHTVYIDLATKGNSYLTYTPLDKSYDKNANILKITPLKIIGLHNASVELSYERKTSRIFSTQIMASYLLPVSFSDIFSDSNPNTKGFRLALEEKFYFKKSAPIGPYLSFEFDYLHSKSNYIGSFRERGKSHFSKSYSDTIGVKKQNYSFNLKFGYQIFVKRFSLDFYVGLGFRYKDVKHLDRINPQDQMIIPRLDRITGIFYPLPYVEGKYLTLSMPLNLKIGWLF